jgi:signal transduction histidine kinase
LKPATVSEAKRARTYSQQSPYGPDDTLSHLSPAPPALHTPGAPVPPAGSPPGIGEWFWRDRLLLGACAFCALLLSYQLAVTLLHPAWIAAVTDWLRAALAWPALLVAGFACVWLTRAHRRCALSWWMATAALLSYTLARTLWTVSNRIIFQHGVPFPSFPDLFFVLQYPFFFLAVLLVPHARRCVPRVLMILDCLLLVGAAAALDWAFVLAPLYVASGIAPLARAILLTYPVGDLFVFGALIMTLVRPCRYSADRVSLGVLAMAFACLFVADFWVGVILVSPHNANHVYSTGSPPDLFWMAFYVLLPLAALVQLRMAQHEPPWNRDLELEEAPRERLRWDDFKASLRFFLPLVVALLVSAIVAVHAALTLGRPKAEQMIACLAVSAGLLLLVIVRQEITFLENARLQRERAAAQATAQALQQTTERMDEFIATAGHDLRTPLGAVVGYIDLAALRCERLGSAALKGACVDVAERMGAVQRSLDEAAHGATRLIRVVNLLFETAQARTGTIELHPAEVELGAVVREAVDALRITSPNRTIDLEEAGDVPLLVIADAGRISQVVTNYLTNALKYSADDQPVEVRVASAGSAAYVSVRDYGTGIPVVEQERIWRRFYRAPGIAVRSGTNIGLGLGLHISKAIIEQHGGQVGVESTVGRGSTFWFTLPLADAHAAPSGPASSFSSR